MGLLRRLVGRIVGGRVKVRDDRNSAHRLEAGRLAILQLCTHGSLNEAVRVARAVLPPPASADHALDLLRRIALPIMLACERRNDAYSACDVEDLIYERLIKTCEDPRHYEACYSLVEASLEVLGRRAGAKALPELDAVPRRLLFFAHNIEQDLAHIGLLCELIDAYLQACPEHAPNLGLIGASNGVPAAGIRRLCEKWGIAIKHVAPSVRRRDLYHEAVRLIDEGHFDRLVFVSLPNGLSYVSGLLPPSRLAWLSMKYQLSCFQRLDHRCSFRSGVRRTMRVGTTEWRQAAPLFTTPIALHASGQASQVIEQARRFTTVFYTVNREDKIRNKDYLAAVATILERVPGSAFVWTGRQRLPDIDAFFNARGLEHRHFFAGWVVPDDLVLRGDIFLDTPVLSGIVAAQAAAAGRPVVTDADSISWIGTFLPAYAAEHASDPASELSSRVEHLGREGLHLRCHDRIDYVNQAVLLAGSAALREAFGTALKLFAARYFFDAQRSAVDHFENMRALSGKAATATQSTASSP